MLEAIDCLGRSAVLEHKLGGDETAERGLQLVFGKTRDGMQ
jgi:hypothetical protein